MFSTGCRYFISFRHKVSGNLFDSCDGFLSEILQLARAHTAKAPKGAMLLVLSPGVEPGAPVPQTEILSIKLREH